jgi:hypothetical protein
MTRCRLWALAALACLPALAGEAPKPAYDPSRFVSTKGKVVFVPLNDPKVLKASEVTYLDDGDIVLGISLDGEARAYPVRFIAFHHVVNDTIAGKPACVTY